MRINIKKLGIDMELKNNGMEIDVSNTKNKHLGDLYIKRSGVEWCKGKTTEGKGVFKNWDEFIAWFTLDEES